MRAQLVAEWDMYLRRTIASSHGQVLGLKVCCHFFCQKTSPKLCFHEGLHFIFDWHVRFVDLELRVVGPTLRRHFLADRPFGEGGDCLRTAGNCWSFPQVSSRELRVQIGKLKMMHAVCHRYAPCPNICLTSAHRPLRLTDEVMHPC